MEMELDKPQNSDLFSSPPLHHTMWTEEDTLAAAGRLNVDLQSLDLDSIILPPGQDVGILSDDDDLKVEEGAEFEEDLRNIIVVDNLPLVPKGKFKKLEGVIRRICGEIGVIEDGLWMPIDPGTEETLGYCFLEHNTTQEANLAKEKLNGRKLGKSGYILAFNTFDDFERILNVPEQWSPPEIKPYTPGENLQNWLKDEKARDQFVIRAGADTEVLWNDARQSKAELVFQKSYWTDRFVQWSPLGTYLATIHRKGAQVWGGATTFNSLMKFPHEQARLIDFSPGERFLVTCDESNSGDAHIKIFDVRTGKEMKHFQGSVVSWPLLRWSGGGEDEHFARIEENSASVYETETFDLVGKKSLQVENVADFSWSPTDSVLAIYIPEMGGGNQPAKVSLVQIPSKKELRQKNFYSVSDCKMYWQSNGDYLAVKVEYYTKSKKSMHTSFELFRMRERDIPVETLELENKFDKIIAFAWEPKGHRFALIHGDDSSPDVSFYSVRNRVSKLTTLKGKKANALYWSPKGRFIILAGLERFNGQLEFYDVDELQTIAQAEHFMATNVEWDPTGRYVVTAVTSVHEMENGFNMWSFYGKLLYQIFKDNFFQFLWRPRPASLLTAEMEEEIAKNLNKYSKKYEAEDEDVSISLRKQRREERMMIREEWNEWVCQWKRLNEEEKLERKKLLGEEEEEEGYEEIQVEIENLLDVSEEYISF